MAKSLQKTRAEPQLVAEFIAGLENPVRKAEALALVEIYGRASGYSARLYTGGMIGFGHYAYTYASGHSGTAMATGFAPRKADLSLYGLKGGAEAAALLPTLGKHREGVGCIYAKRLSDLDAQVLARLIVAGLENLRAQYPVTPE